MSRIACVAAASHTAQRRTQRHAPDLFRGSLDDLFELAGPDPIAEILLAAVVADAKRGRATWSRVTRLDVRDDLLVRAAARRRMQRRFEPGTVVALDRLELVTARTQIVAFLMTAALPPVAANHVSRSSAGAFDKIPALRLLSRIACLDDDDGTTAANRFLEKEKVLVRDAVSVTVDGRSGSGAERDADQSAGEHSQADHRSKAGKQRHGPEPESTADRTTGLFCMDRKRRFTTCKNVDLSVTDPVRLQCLNGRLRLLE